MSKYRSLFIVLILGCTYFLYRFLKEPIKRGSSRRRISYDFHTKRGMNKTKAYRKSIKYVSKKNFNKYRFNTVKSKIR